MQAQLAVRSYKLSQRLEPGSADNLYNMGVLQLRTPGMAREGAFAMRHSCVLIRTLETCGEDALQRSSETP